MSVFKAIPGNYPSWIRSNARFWWTLCIFPTELIETFGLFYLLQPIFDDFSLHLAAHTLMYDAFQRNAFQFSAAIAAVTGDLPARSALSGFTKGSFNIN